MTKVRTKETIPIEKMLVPGKSLSSLRRSIYFMPIISLIYRFGSGTFSFIPSWWMIFFLSFYRVTVVNVWGFDKLDRLFVSWLTTT
jgi:hypothetical protein